MQTTRRLFRARQIVTLAGPAVTGLVTEGPAVVATGDADELAAAFPDAERHDLTDGVIVPGFHDAHQHITHTAENLLHLDLSPGAVATSSELLDAVTAAAEIKPRGDWIRGSRYDETKTSGGVPITRSDLDRVAPDHPVLITQVAGHWGIVNSRALDLMGLDDDSEPPPGGDLGRDGTGRLNGILYEKALLALAYDGAGGQPVVPPTSQQERLEGFRRATEMFHAAGITSVTDAFVGPADLDLLRRAETADLLTLRVNYLVGLEHESLWREQARTGQTADARLRYAGVKTFVDGAIAGRTCSVHEPFEGTDDHGMLVVSPDELHDAVRTVHDAGSRIGVHANGDRAIELLLDQFERVTAASPRAQPRHRIEHCTVVTPEIVERIGRLGAVPVPFGSYVSYHGDKLLDWYGPDRLGRMFAHRWMLDAGIPVAGSSDFPCGPYEPLLALRSCVTRQSESGDVLGAGQRISPAEALALYTTGAAYSVWQEDVLGTLAPGMLADFVVLDDDPLQVDPAQLADLQVRATYVDADRVWAGR